jgi:hypothetical protein
MSKKQDRRRQKRHRHEQAERGQVERQRRQFHDEAMARLTEATERLADAARDESTDPAVLVERVTDLFDDPVWGTVLVDASPVVDLGREVGEVVDGERAATLVDALLEAAGDDPRLAWLAVGLAAERVARDAERGELVDRAAAWLLAAGSPPPAVAAVIAIRWTAIGRIADALDLLADATRRAPQMPDLQQLRAMALARLAAAQQGRDDHWEAPVPPDQRDRAEREAARVADDVPVGRLWDAVQARVAADPELDRWQRGEVQRAAARLDAEVGPWGPGQFGARLRPAPDAPDIPAAVRAIATERSWLSGPYPPEHPEDEDLPEDRTLLGRVAEAPDTPPAVAADARSWLEHVRYGLWQLDVEPPAGDTAPPVTVLATDLLTRVTMNAAVPAGILEGLPRRSVLAGPLAPLDGVWRPGRGVLVLDPTLADAVAEAVLDIGEQVIVSLAEQHGVRPPHHRASRRMVPLPHGALAELLPEMERDQAELGSKVLSNVLYQLVELVEHQGGARATTADGDPFEDITAAFPTLDPQGVRRRLEGRADIDEAAAGDARRGEVAAPLHWWGRAPGDDHEEQATLRFGIGRVIVEAHSQIALSGVMRVLVGAGVTTPPEVRRAAAAEPDGVPSDAEVADAAAEEAWRRAWCDQPLPTLGGVTPRQAAESGDGERLVRVESLLQRLEHAADVARLEGRPAPDVDALRHDLQLEERLGALLPPGEDRPAP